jgi:hypothetical protein
MVQQISRKSLFSRSSERPKGWRQADLVQFFLSLFPKVEGLIREMKRDNLNKGDWLEHCVCEDESAARRFGIQ